MEQTHTTHVQTHINTYAPSKPLLTQYWYKLNFDRWLGEPVEQYTFDTFPQMRFIGHALESEGNNSKKLALFKYVYIYTYIYKCGLTRACRIW